MWFTNESSFNIGRIDDTGKVTLYPLPDRSQGTYIAQGPDGAMWFTDQGDSIGRIDTSGNVTLYPLPNDRDGNYFPLRITKGPDNAMWFTVRASSGNSKIDRIDMSGNITEYSLPDAELPNGITTGPDGALWFADDDPGGLGGEIGRITTSGSVSLYGTPSGQSSPLGITSGPDGNIWFTDFASAQIGMVTTAGAITEYPTPTPLSEPVSITTGRDGDIWFTEQSNDDDNSPTDNIGQLNPDPELTAASPVNIPVLTYDAAPGANSYNIYRNGQLLATSTTNTYTDNTAPLGTDTYYVTPVNGGVEGDKTNSIRVSVVTYSNPSFTSSNTATTPMRTNPGDFFFNVTTTGSPQANISETGALPTGITFTNYRDGTARIEGVAPAGTQGNYPLTLTATSAAGTTTQAFTLTVTTAPTAPYFTGPNSQDLQFGTPFSISYSSSGYPVPKFTKSGTLPAGVNLTDNGDGSATLSGTPTGSAIGAYSVTIIAKNLAGRFTQSLSLTVFKSPAFKSVPVKNLTASVGTAYSLTTTSSAYYTADIAESGGLPDGLSFVDNGDGTATISGTPATGTGGTYTVTEKATNSYGSATLSLPIKVDEVPVITSASSSTATAGSAFTYQVTDTGYPKPSLTETGSLPRGVTFKAATGAFVGTPKAGTAGSYPVTITAKNSAGTTTQNFILTVH